MLLITIKLPRNPKHNPHDKQTAPCPATGKMCTDATGQYHTVVWYNDDIEAAKAAYSEYHIMRIEDLAINIKALVPELRDGNLSRSEVYKKVYNLRREFGYVVASLWAGVPK